MFWGETLLTVVHVINLSPIVALDDEVLNKVLTRKNIFYDHLQVFGHKCSVHIPKDEISKLDVKSRECIFLSYDQDEFCYTLYDPVAKKLVRNRDVIFYENETIENIYKAKDSELKEKGEWIDLDTV